MSKIKKGSELRGHSFVAKRYYVFARGGVQCRDLLGRFIKATPRECGSCFFRNPPARGDDCTHPESKKAFGISVEAKMPKAIDGKEVGHYCPYHFDYDGE